MQKAHDMFLLVAKVVQIVLFPVLLVLQISILLSSIDILNVCINPLKASPPDFDVDFYWEDKNNVSNCVFKHFKNTALLATYNTFRYKAGIRQQGKVFGLPQEEINKLNKTSKQQKTFLNSAETP
jgi:ABC-type maltose transport system permease subunit